MLITKIFDTSAFIFILLACIYSVKIYYAIKAKAVFWLILATAYGLVLRTLYFLSTLGLIERSGDLISRLFAGFYILLFIGIYKLHQAVKNVGDINAFQPE